MTAVSERIDIGQLVAIMCIIGLHSIKREIQPTGSLAFTTTKNPVIVITLMRHSGKEAKDISGKRGNSKKRIAVRKRQFRPWECKYVHTVQ